MTNEIEVQKWDAIRDMANEVDQMASQTVLRACDIGDMLREVRAAMSYEKFTNEVMSKLNRSHDWAFRMIILSFRRSAVTELLAKGMSDSISAAYKHVKGLPAPKEEEAEREQWPRAKRGPAKGEGGRPKRQAKPKEARYSWVDIVVGHGLIGGNSGGKVRKKLKAELIEVEPSVDFPRGGLDEAGAVTLHAACERLKEKRGAESPEWREAEKPRAITCTESAIEAEIQGRVNSTLQGILDDYNKVHDKHISVINSYKGVFTQKEFKLLVSVLHPDRYPDLDDVQRKKMDNAFDLIKGKETVLCGVEKEIVSTLPKTVSDLFAMRKKK